MNSLTVKTVIYDFGFCQICDNHTPRVYVEEFEQECCALCYEAYGDCN